MLYFFEMQVLANYSLTSSSMTAQKFMPPHLSYFGRFLQRKNYWIFKKNLQDIKVLELPLNENYNCGYLAK